MKLLSKSVLSAFFVDRVRDFRSRRERGFFSKSTSGCRGRDGRRAIAERRAVVAFTLLLAPNPAGDPKALAAFLSAHPGIKLTLLFPPNYFDGAERKAAMKNFQVLQSSQQIEIGLTLENQPMLPLLADLSTAGAKWNVEFHVARRCRRPNRARQRHLSTPLGLVAVGNRAALFRALRHRASTTSSVSG